MTALKPSIQRARRRVVWTLLIGAAVASGWVAPGSLALQTSASGSRTMVDDEVSQLLHAMWRRDLDAEERQRLLERLPILERLEDAKVVLQ